MNQVEEKLKRRQMSRKKHKGISIIHIYSIVSGTQLGQNTIKKSDINIQITGCFQKALLELQSC